MYEKTKEARLTEFLTGFQEIKSQLKRVYRSITNGGDADLELVDSFDPFSEVKIFENKLQNVFREWILAFDPQTKTGKRFLTCQEERKRSVRFL